uniref:Uncharacterized protein n=1 Tax=Physcomitrium patens TaxID=3218 RepID=A9RPX9_PHYPA|nr:hypothetical protein PHYPA_001233 [Physcomitrium patens]
MALSLNKQMKKVAPRPLDPARYNESEALEKTKKAALFRGVLQDSLMEREVFDHFTRMDLRSPHNSDPVFDSRHLHQFAAHKASILQILIPGCFAAKQISTTDYQSLKDASANIHPHIRYRVCPCCTITDCHVIPLPPPPWPDYLAYTPSFP